MHRPCQSLLGAQLAELRPPIQTDLLAGADDDYRLLHLQSRAEFELDVSVRRRRFRRDEHEALG